MEVEIKSNLSAVYSGTHWFLTINGNKVGPAIKSEANIKWLLGWFHIAKSDIAKEWSEELEK